MKKLSRNHLKGINGGISCHCGTRYIGEFGSVASCEFACTIMIKPPYPPIVN